MGVGYDTLGGVENYLVSWLVMLLIPWISARSQDYWFCGPLLNHRITGTLDLCYHDRMSGSLDLSRSQDVDFWPTGLLVLRTSTKSQDYGYSGSLLYDRMSGSLDLSRSLDKVIGSLDL